MANHDLNKSDVRNRVATALQHLARTSSTHGDTAAMRRFNKADYYLADPAFQPRWSCGDLLVPSSKRGDVIHRVKPGLRCYCEAGDQGTECWHHALVEGYQFAFDGVLPESISEAAEKREWAFSAPPDCETVSTSTKIGLPRRKAAVVEEEASALFGEGRP